MSRAVLVLVLFGAPACDRVFGIGDPYEDARVSTNGSDATVDTPPDVVADAVADASLQSQAIVHFPFDADMFDTQFHTTAICVTGNCAPTIGGHVGVGSLAMSNSGCVKFPLAQMPATWSFALWVYPNVATQQTVIARQYGAQSPHLLWKLAGSATSALAFSTYDGMDTTSFGALKLATNTWQHLAATYDGQNLVVYVNAQPDISLTMETIAAAGYPEAFLGCDVGGTTGFFTGNIDDVFVYDRALTIAEINQLYSLGS